ncbi:cysteine desulfurase family protein [Salipaludibacillus daqingensis]|uniref:cysteine desulfurase family protein n=1 Tax=Salipaludibacillus daqingensis TaxID=3041001 RepID=UPI002475B16C|nr:cysteine desulfurase family protein [Salipaludibacillus daqingensis]
MVYFDNSATTRPFPEVIDTFSSVTRTYFANPSSLHPLGKEAEQLLTQARNKTAALLGVKEKEIYFTSGGTEGNNLAVKGTARQLQSRGKHIITTTMEHSSTYEALLELENEGFSVSYVKANEHGQVSVEQIKNEIKPDTILVSMIHVSNELGSIQPVEETGELLDNYPKIVFHVDHVQGVTKVPLNFSNVDLCTISAHKFHGLKGTGVLFMREGIQLTALFSGGQQESGIRPGTENLAGIVSLTKALRMAFDDASNKLEALKERTTRIEAELKKIDGVNINSPAKRAPHILNVSIPYIKPEVIVQALAEKEIYISTKSACSSKQFSPSRVLYSSGFSKEKASSAVRISLSFHNTDEEAEFFVTVFKEVVSNMKKVVNV